jgi:3-oxoacyl-[acyl-carrier-protein] synthase II
MRAIKKVFGDYAHKVSISSTKSMTGHMLGGAGAVEMATCSLAIRDSVIPPTINLENPRRGMRPRLQGKRRALNNSFGFGGRNATLVATAFTG